MLKRTILIIILFLPFLLYGKSRNYVIIRKGDTLWSISRKYKITLTDLCRINNLKPESKLKIGTKIFLFTAKKQNGPVLSLKLNRPVEGEIYSHFQQGKNLIQNSGVEFKTERSAPVRSAEKGTIKYTGTLRGYGNVVIIEHTPSVSTIYAYLDKIMVKKDMKVEKNHVIGTVGRNTFCDLSLLHFELINNGVSINPVKYFN
ncbi:MAG: LysM peptidoglycan-binding domain-containing M23 family metallopeptidase [bacterium]|nr:LysM peptidoglycan-binding domain-containing M23 family metallopeptidase [bacterium]